ncbi:ClpP-like protease [Mycobacterium phage RiverMonster]|nr:ClpP-like protease [Mycobacterium phage RiverMonster]
MTTFRSNPQENRPFLSQILLPLRKLFRGGKPSFEQIMAPSEQGSTLTAPTPMSPALEEATIAKLRAEAAAAEAAAEVSKMETRLKLESVRKEAALARHQTAAAIGQELYVANQERTQKLELLRNHYVHEYHFVDGVNDYSVEACLNQLALWHREDPNCDMHIVMNSPGGSVIAGMHLFDQIAAYSTRPWDTSDRPKGTHKTTMTVRGMAASMGGILLQSVDERIIGPEAYLMIHEISAGTGGKIGEIEDMVGWYRHLCARIAKVFVHRAGGKITAEEFDAGWKRTDWWLDSDEALRYGFVDRIA